MSLALLDVNWELTVSSLGALGSPVLVATGSVLVAMLCMGNLTVVAPSRQVVDENDGAVAGGCPCQVARTRGLGAAIAMSRCASVQSGWSSCQEP